MTNSTRELPPRFTAVLFDLDDTLLDSYAARVAALQSAFEAAGIRHESAERFVSRHRGLQLSAIFEAINAETGADLGLLDLYRSGYWRGYRSVRLFPGVRELLDRLHGSGVRLGLVTQKERRFTVDGAEAGASLELAHVGVAGLFGVVVGFEDVTQHKPHPEGILLAMGQLGARPEATLVVGDSAADIQAALAAGCVSCHATWGQSGAHPLPDGLRPHAVAETPANVLRLLS